MPALKTNDFSPRPVKITTPAAKSAPVYGGRANNGSPDPDAIPVTDFSSLAMVQCITSLRRAAPALVGHALMSVPPFSQSERWRANALELMGRLPGPARSPADSLAAFISFLETSDFVPRYGNTVRALCDHVAAMQRAYSGAARGPATTLRAGGLPYRPSGNVGDVLCTIRARSTFWLRPTATLDHVGPTFPANTIVAILAPTSITGRSASGTALTVYQVRVASNDTFHEGFAAFSAAEVASCAATLAAVAGGRTMVSPGVPAAAQPPAPSPTPSVTPPVANQSTPGQPAPPVVAPPPPTPSVPTLTVPPTPQVPSIPALPNTPAASAQDAPVASGPSAMQYGIAAVVGIALIGAVAYAVD